MFDVGHPAGGSVSFFVPGTPRPQGSKDYRGHRGGKPILVESSTGLKAWRDAVGWVARSAMKTPPPAGPVALVSHFVLPPPKSSRDGDVMLHAIRPPDSDKLQRAVMDALTGACYLDDAQVVDQRATKRYGQPAGCHITVTALGNWDMRGIDQ